MKFGVIKSLGKVLSKSKDTIVKHGPQIMAAAGAACFIGGTICAIKETPNAMKKLEEKKALDKNMTKLQKGAVLLPEYKKTEACVAAGIVFTGLAWHLEAKHVATLLAAITTANEQLQASEKENSRLIEAAKQVVGEEKTEEIKTKKEEITAKELEMESVGALPSDQIPYPMLFPNGTEIWMTWSDFRTRIENCIKKAAKCKQIKESDYFRLMGLSENKINDVMEENGWQACPNEVASNVNPEDWLKWAYETLDYHSEPYDYDHYRHISGWKIKWSTEPDYWDEYLIQ